VAAVLLRRLLRQERTQAVADDGRAPPDRIQHSKSVLQVVTQAHALGVGWRHPGPTPAGEGVAVVAERREVPAVGGEVTMIEENAMEHDERKRTPLALSLGVYSRKPAHLHGTRFSHRSNSSAQRTGRQWLPSAVVR
jgi:hypothetical protein